MGMIVVFFIAAVLSASMGLQVKVQQSSYEVARGGNITLGCKFVPAVQVTSSTLVVINWNILPDDPNLDTTMVATYYSNNLLDVPPEYADRISMNPDISTGQADLIISRVTMAENSVFECSVHIPKDIKGQLSDKTRLTVLVAPSKPTCNIQGTPEISQNINLTCNSQEGSPVPTYSWDSYDVRNNRRGLPPKSTNNKGVLSLFNISTDTSGYYICNSVNKIGSASCNFTLSVMPPSMNIGSTAIIIGASAAGLLVLAIIIYCCCCRKKNEYDKGDPDEMEFHDRENDDDIKKEYSDDKEKYGERLEKKSDGVGVYEERAEKTRERRDDYDDQRDDYSDRRGKYDDSRDRYNDRRDDYDRRDDKYDERSDRYNDRRDDYNRRDGYNDRRDDYDRRDRYNDRRDDYDRRDRYNDRRDDYDHRDRYNDRRDDYDRRDRYDDRRDDYDHRDNYDQRDKYDERSDRHYGRRDQYDEVYDDRRDKDDDKRPPNVPPNKPKKMDDQ